MKLSRAGAHGVLEIHHFMHREILHQRIGAHDCLQALAVTQSHHALKVALLGAAVGVRLLGKPAPIDELIKAPERVQIDHHLRDEIAHAWIFQQRLAADVRIAALIDDSLD